MRFRKKSVEIDAMQLTWEGAPEALKFCQGVPVYDMTGKMEALVIDTLEGEMLCQFGDWIIKGVKGEFYPCKPDIFAATYEAVE